MGIFLFVLVAKTIPLIIESPWIAVIIYATSIYTFHIARSDKNFLRQVVAHPPTLFFFEYGSISIPFFAILISSFLWIPVLVLLVCILVISYIKKTWIIDNLSRTKSFSLLPVSTFEWQSGIRKDWLIILIIIIAACLFAQHLIVIPVAMLVLLFTITRFYLEAEPRQMLEVFRLSPKKFLRLKYKQGLLLSATILLPLALLYLTLHSEYWYVMVFLIFECIVIQILSINLKYSIYIPGERLSFNSVIIAFCAACFLLPVLAPIPLLMLYKYYIKALKNLKQYLYAYN